MPGKIIALEGIDQSGKRTQARLLANHLKREGAKTSTISFPIYNSSSGHQIRRYLDGRQRYPPEALHMLYSLNRWENRKMIDKFLTRSDFLIADRYTPSNLAYGVAKGLSLTWLVGLDKGLPLPTIVLVLDVPVQSSFMRKRENRDVHERNEKFLAGVENSYRVLARSRSWEIVDATLPVAEVHNSIWKLIARKFKASLLGMQR